jgi:hypothetical protein
VIIRYAWKEGWQPPIDAQEAGEELQRIKAKRGELTAATIVDESRRKRAVLHDVFEWDDATAAGKHREEQARAVVRAVVIRKVGRENSPPVRAFVSLTPDKEDRQYIATTDARDDPFLRQQMLDRALDELLSMKRRYGDMQEFAGVVGAINELQEQLEVAA